MTYNKFLNLQQMNPYLDKKTFDQLYTIKDNIIKLSRTHVFSTLNSEAIKYSSIDWSLTDICYLMQFKHPNIIKLLNYTLINENNTIMIKYAMPLGQKIREIYNHQEELLYLIYDITSALKYLKDMGYVYADLKPENIVRFPPNKNQRAKYVLIDMGFVRPYMNLRDGEIFTGIAYTLPFRDFQFYKNYNNISCEIYSLGQTIRSILANCSSIYLTTLNRGEIVKNMSKYFPNISLDVRQKLYNLINRMITQPSQRISFTEILSNSLFSKIKGFDNEEKKTETPSKIKKSKSKITSKIWSEVRHWLCFERPIIFDLDLRGMFVTLNNIKQCLYFCDETNIQTCVSVNAYLTSVLLHSSTEEYIDMVPNLGEYFEPNEFIPMLVKVITTLQKDFIPKTEWNFSSTNKEILIGFADALSLESNITKRIIEKILPSKQKGKLINLHTSYNKFLSALNLPIVYTSLYGEELISEQIENKTLSFRKNSNIWIQSPEQNVSSLQNFTGDTENIQNINELFNSEIDVGIIMFIDEYLIENQELGNYFILILKDVREENLERYSYFLNLEILSQHLKMNVVKLRKLMKFNNIYTLCRNEELSPLLNRYASSPLITSSKLSSPLITSSDLSPLQLANLSG